LLQDRDAVRACEQEGQGEEVLHDDVDLTLDAREPEVFVGGRVLGGCVVADDPVERGEAFRGERGCVDERVVRSADGHPAIAVELRRGQIGEVPAGQDHQVRAAECCGSLVHRRAVRGLDAEANVGCPLFEQAQERATEHGEGVVGHDHREFAVRGHGVEYRSRGEGVFHIPQGDLGLVEQRDREWGEDVALPVAGKQLVAEVAAQSGEGGAGRGLAQADALARPGDAAFTQEGVQRDEQVQVDAW